MIEAYYIIKLRKDPPPHPSFRRGRASRSRSAPALHNCAVALTHISIPPIYPPLLRRVAVSSSIDVSVSALQVAQERCSHLSYRPPTNSHPLTNSPISCTQPHTPITTQAPSFPQSLTSVHYAPHPCFCTVALASSNGMSNH